MNRRLFVKRLSSIAGIASVTPVSVFTALEGGLNKRDEWDVFVRRLPEHKQWQILFRKNNWVSGVIRITDEVVDSDFGFIEYICQITEERYKRATSTTEDVLRQIMSKKVIGKINEEIT